MASDIRINGNPTPVENIKIGDTVTLSNADNTGVTTWQWALLAKPAGSTAALTTPTSSTSTFVADMEGSWLVKLTTNGSVDDTAVARVLATHTGAQLMARGEVEEGDSSGVEGWAKPMRTTFQAIDKRIGLTSRKTVKYVGSNTTGPKLLKLTGSAILSNGDVVPTADQAAIGTGYGALMYFDSSSALNTNDIISPVEQGFTNAVSNPDSLVAEDKVYMSSTAGALTKTQASSNAILVAYCVEVSGPNVRMWFDPGQSVSGGGTLTGAGSSGAVAFWAGATSLTEDPTQLFWDNTNNRLGVGTASPANQLHIYGSTDGLLHVDSQDSSGNNSGITVNNAGAGTGHAFIKFMMAGTEVAAVAGNDTEGFGMVDGLSLRASSGREIGFRIANTSVGRFKTNGDFLVDTNTLYVDAVNNRVGVGTATPSTATHIKAGSNAADGSRTNILTLHGSSYGAGAETQLLFRGGQDATNGSGVGAGIAAVDVGSYDLRLDFRTRNNAAYDASELTTAHTRMCIDVDGNIGVGITTPAEKLHVSGNVRFSGALMPSGSAGTSGQVLTSAGSGSPPTWTTPSGGLGGSGSSGALAFWTGASTLGEDPTQLFWDNTNNRLGIGTNSPDTLLHVTGAPGTALIKVENTNVGGYSGIYFTNNSGSVRFSSGFANASAAVAVLANKAYINHADADLVFSRQVSSTYTETAKVSNSTGNWAFDTDTLYVDATNNRVGVGTTSPSHVLSVQQSVASASIVKFQNTSTSGLSASTFYDSGGTARGGVGSGNSAATSPYINNVYLQSTNGSNLIFLTGTGATPTERMRIDTSGNITADTNTWYVDAVNNRVGVLTTSPQKDLHVNGELRVDNTFTERRDAANAVAQRSYPQTLSNTNRITDFYANSDTANSAVFKFGVISATGWITDDVTGCFVASTKAGTGTTKDLHLVANNGTGTFGLTAADVTMTLQANTKRVGIGTTSPSVALDVIGAAKVSGNFTVDTDTLHVDATNNRVGIGTTSPSSQFHIQGTNSMTWDGNTLTVDNINTTRSVANVVIKSTASDDPLPNIAYLHGSTVLGSIEGWNESDQYGMVRGLNLSIHSPSHVLGIRSVDGITTTQRAGFKHNGDFYVDPASNTFYVDATNNRVGVGTATPAVAVDVVGCIGTTVTSGSVGWSISNGVDSTMQVVPVGSGQMRIRTDFAGRWMSFAPEGGSTDVMAVRGTGVHIGGTSSPSSTLQVTGTIGASGTVTGSNLSGTNTGDVTLASFGSTPNANGASLSGQQVTLQPADASNPGGVSTSAQTFAGAKTFSAQVSATLGVSSAAPNVYDGETSITAYAGGGQTNATALTAEINFATTVATTGDSVKLPTATLGSRIVVFNDGANSMDIFPASGNQIDSLGANNAYSLTAGSSREFFGKSSTDWRSR